MPSFGSRSRERLEGCHDNLRLLMNEVVKGFDCTILSGFRTVEEQQELYARGRTKPGPIVTSKDGVNRRSKHQGDDGNPPSLAVDVAPWPIDWGDTERFVLLAGYILGTARRMGIAVRWGGDWDRDTEVEDERFRDLPHFELVL